jgi:hypothetical protein
MSPDITMCKGGDCPLRDNCHRYLAKPYRVGQSYCAIVPYKDGECKYYWPEKREDVK